MLARALPGVPVLVCAGSLSGRPAGRDALRLHGAASSTTGFSICSWRATSICCWCRRRDLDERVLPSGRLREPLDAARVRRRGARARHRRRCRSRVGDARACRRRSAWRRAIGRAAASSAKATAPAPAGARVVAVAGIARPERFFGALARAGLGRRRASCAFPDHHWFTPTRSRRRSTTPRRRRAPRLVVTTEKDAVRLAPEQAWWAVLPMEVAIEPAERFASWLRGDSRLSRHRRYGEASR